MEQDDQVGGDAVAQQIGRVASFVLNFAAEPVASIDEIEIDAQMREPASNTVGAWLRVAYWLAVGLRVQQYRYLEARRAGDIAAYVPSSKIERLRGGAVLALFSGVYAAGFSATRYSIGWFPEYLLQVSGYDRAVRSDDPALIREVYEVGIGIASRASANRVQRELQELAAKDPREDRAGLDLPDFIDDPTDPLVIAIGVGVALVVGWFALPFLTALASRR